MTSCFTHEELACRCGCSILNLSQGFLEKLTTLREYVHHPMSITSGCRCPEHNKAINGKPDSFHLISHPWGCCAVDVSMYGWPSQKRWKFIKTALDQGWSIGLNWQKSFIHLDRRSDYPATKWPEPVFFPY